MKRLYFCAVLLLAGCASTPAPRPSAAAGALPSDSGRVYDISQVTVKPQLANRAAVGRALEQNYSGALRDEGAEGTVHFRVLIGVDGVPKSIDVTRTTNSAFNAPGLAVIRAMRFTPAQVDGVVVPVRVELPVRFSPRS